MVSLWVTIKGFALACKGKALDCDPKGDHGFLCAAKLVKTEGFKSILLAFKILAGF